MAPSLTTRANKVDIAAAVTGSCVGVGVLVIAGLFFLCYKYRQTLTNLSKQVEKYNMSDKAERRHKTVTSKPKDLYQGRLYKKQSSETFDSGASRPKIKCPGPLLPISNFYIPPSDLNFLDKPLPDPSARQPPPGPQHASTAGQISVSRIMTTIPEGRTMSDASGTIPLKYCRTWSWSGDRPQSTWTMSTLGLELLQDTMQEPRPAYFNTPPPMPPMPLMPSVSPINRDFEKRKAQGQLGSYELAEDLLFSPRSRKGLIW